MADEITNAILTDAQGPAEVQSDSGRVKMRSLTELIEADKYLKEASAARSGSPWRGLYWAKVVPPGST